MTVQTCMNTMESPTLTINDPKTLEIKVNTVSEERLNRIKIETLLFFLSMIGQSQSDTRCFFISLACTLGMVINVSRFILILRLHPVPTPFSSKTSTITCTNVALAVIARDFKVEAATLQWLVTAFSLSSASRSYLTLSCETSYNWIILTGLPSHPVWEIGRYLWSKIGLSNRSSGHCDLFVGMWVRTFQYSPYYSSGDTGYRSCGFSPRGGRFQHFFSFEELRMISLPFE
jgi:hypothetical protein